MLETRNDYATDDQETIITMEESSSSASSTASCTSRSRDLSARDLSAPYFDDGNLVPIKTNMQFYWDCPEPSSSSPVTNGQSNSQSQAKQRLFLPMGTHLFPKRLTARIIPGVAGTHDKPSSVHVEYEPLPSS